MYMDMSGFVLMPFLNKKSKTGAMSLSSMTTTHRFYTLFPSGRVEKLWQAHL